MIVAVVGVGVTMLGVLVTMRGAIADIDKLLVAVETLLHERTGRPLVSPEPENRTRLSAGALGSNLDCIQ